MRKKKKTRKKKIQKKEMKDAKEEKNKCKIIGEKKGTQTRQK